MEINEQAFYAPLGVGAGVPNRDTVDVDCVVVQMFPDAFVQFVTQRSGLQESYSDQIKQSAGLAANFTPGVRLRID